MPARQSFWDCLQELVPAWNAMIGGFDARTGSTGGWESLPDQSYGTAP
jgi:hypothetical protein